MQPALFFYNLGIRLYGLAIGLAALWDPKARQWKEGRRGLWGEMAAKLKPGGQRIWIHCASLGEFEQGRPLIEKLKTTYPDRKIVLTFFSPSGYEIRKDYPYADHVFYLPLDTRSNAVKFLEHVQPALAVFVKYEFWFHHLDELKRRQVPTYLISAIFRADQVFFKWYGGLFRHLLHGFAHIFVQERESLLLLDRFKLQNISVTGDTRIDRVLQVQQDARQLPMIEAFKGTSNLLIAGSSWEAEHDLLVKFIVQHRNGNDLNLKYVIAPHDIHPEKIDRLAAQIGGAVQRYSQADESGLQQAEVLIIDNIGLLNAIYRYGFIAVIGGGFKQNIHNILEPAAFGLPVIFGPKYRGFGEAVDLIASGGAFCVRNYKEFEAKVMDLARDSEQQHQAGEQCRQYIDRKKGATDAIMQQLQ